ncbi:MAG: hypothetical protein ABI571_07505, partial [Actinomycetota bacterium]
STSSLIEVFKLSTAICEFLDEASPSTKLLPNDIILKAKVRAFCSEIACNIQPIQNLLGAADDPLRGVLDHLGES